MLDAVASRLAAARCSVAWVDGLELLPTFVPELVDDVPASVRDFCQQLDQADLVVMAVPEYAAGMAGSTKNALDWLVGAATLYHKPVAVICAGTTGGERTIEQLVHTVSWQGGLTLATMSVAAPRTKMTDGDLTDSETLADVQLFTDELINAVHGHAADRRTLLSRVVDRFGIDIERFGEIA